MQVRGGWWFASVLVVASLSLSRAIAQERGQVVIVLRDGQELRGELVDFQELRYRLRQGETVREVAARDVLRVEFVEGARTADTSALAAYFPVATGNQWTFQVVSEAEPAKGTTLPDPVAAYWQTLEVGQPAQDGRWELRSWTQRGAVNLGRLQVQEGFLTLGQGASAVQLLPLGGEPGTTWSFEPAPGVAGRAELLAGRFEVTTPAGTFQDCLKVKVEVARTARVDETRVRHTYYLAPGVGPVQLRLERAPDRVFARHVQTSSLVRSTTLGDPPVTRLERPRTEVPGWAVYGQSGTDPGPAGPAGPRLAVQLLTRDGALAIEVRDWNTDAPVEGCAVIAVAGEDAERAHARTDADGRASLPLGREGFELRLEHDAWQHVALELDRDDDAPVQRAARPVRTRLVVTDRASSGGHRAAFVSLDAARVIPVPKGPDGLLVEADLWIEPGDPEITGLTARFDGDKYTHAGPDTQVALLPGRRLGEVRDVPGDVVWKTKLSRPEITAGAVFLVRASSGAIYEVRLERVTADVIALTFAPLEGH